MKTPPVLSLDQARARAAALGFTQCAVTPAAPSPFLAAYERWIAEGMHGTMGYMARADRVARRRDLNVILPGVRSILLVAVDYRQQLPAALLADPHRGRIASYAWSADYHDRMTPALESLAATLAGSLNDDEQPAHRVYVDTGAVLERGHAHAAGMGFIGKNTMVIHPRRGSYFFLGEILITAPFDRYDTPTMPPTMCGSCTRCLTACPTAAFPAPHVLDARRCISYLTIEHKGDIPPDLRSAVGNWVYGCDVCQEVCPFNRFAPLVPAPLLIDALSPADGTTLIDRAAPLLADLLTWDDATFRARFAGSAVLRTGWERMMRNACVAAGNSGDTSLVSALATLRDHPSALIADHAAWALSRL